MDCILYLEATVATSGKRIILYVPVEYQEKLRKLHGKRLRLIAIIEDTRICSNMQEYES